MIFTPKKRTAALLATTLVFTGVFVLISCGKSTVAEAPLRPVKLVTVDIATTAPVIELAGDVHARVESRPGFRVGGKILSRRVDAGQHVKRGEELARIDARDYQLAHSAADSQLAARRADFANAQSEFARFQDLREKGYVSVQDIDRVRVALSAADSALKQAESNAALENNRLGDTVLRADADGVVTSTLIDVGTVVEPGAPVVILAQDGPRDVVTEFPEDRTALARIAKAEVSLWAQPGVKFPATLRELSGSADPVTRTYRARYSVQAPANALGLGQSAAVRLLLPATTGGVRLPTTALLGNNGVTEVWVFDPASSTVKRTPVQMAGIDGNSIVVAGLAAGTQVVTAGVHVLGDGQKVRPMPAEPVR